MICKRIGICNFETSCKLLENLCIQYYAFAYFGGWNRIIMEKKQKEQTIQKILEVIEQKLADKQMKQKDLLELCHKEGYELSQSELSRILSHKIAIGLYPALAICDVLNIDIHRIINSVGAPGDISYLSEESFIMDPKRPEIRKYLGSFQTLFYATNPRENKLLYGRLDLAPKRSGNKSYCSACFLLDTGDRDMGGTLIQKEYQGQFFVSPKIGVAYCFLVNNELGEICSLEFRHRTFFYKRVECRIGLVLTTSTGERKTPAMHKILIYRGEPESPYKDQLAHMLKLDNHEMRIEASALRDIDTSDETRELLSRLTQMQQEITYYIVNAASLKNVNRKLSNAQISSLYSILRNYSEESYTLRLDEEEDEMIFDLIGRNLDSSQSYDNGKSNSGCDS